MVIYVYIIYIHIIYNLLLCNLLRSAHMFATQRSNETLVQSRES